MLEKFYVELREIKDQWNDAEKLIKRSEQISDVIVAPAILELRYAGRRIVDALNGVFEGKPESEIRNYLVDARFRCHCAKHDAIDAAVSRISIDLRDMVERLEPSNITTIFPRFSETFTNLHSIKDKIAETRGNRENRLEVYDEISSSNFKKLINDYREIQTCRFLMFQQQKKSRRRIFVQHGLTIFLGLTTIILGVIFWLYPPPVI